MCAETPSSFTSETSLIFAAARSAACDAEPDRPFQSTPERDGTFEQELAWLSADREGKATLVRVLFPAGIPLTPEFYEVMARFSFHLGFTKWASPITTCIWISALQLLSPQDVQAVLLALAQTGQAFFDVHHGLPEVVGAIPLPSSFMAEWFPSLVTRLGDDQDTEGESGAIDRYCEKDPVGGLDTAISLTGSTSSEVRASIASQIIGVLRSVPLEALQQARFTAFQEQLAASSNPAHRHCCLRSWAATAHRRSLNAQEFDRLLERCTSDIPEDMTEGVGVVCRAVRAPALDEACFLRGLAWLRQRALPNLSHASKHAITITINSVVERYWSLSTQPESDPWTILQGMLPIAPDCLGTWRALEDFVVKQVLRERTGWEQMLQTIGERSTGVIYPLLRETKVFTRLISQMMIRRHEGFVARLIFQAEIGGRELGFGLFERLGIDAFSSAILDTVNENDLRIALFVFRALAMHGNVVARFLWAVAPRFQTGSQEAQAEFAEELLIQCKNYPHSCLAALKPLENPPVLVRTALEQAESYFNAREKARTSPFNTMLAPGYRRMAERKWRTLNREIHDQAHEQSIFAQFFTNVEMLYGDRFCSYNEAGLSETTPMQQHSIEFEFPHLEFIAPEDMALRRLHALTMIQVLKEPKES